MGLILAILLSVCAEQQQEAPKQEVSVRPPADLLCRCGRSSAVFERRNRQQHFYHQFQQSLRSHELVGGLPVQRGGSRNSDLLWEDPSRDDATVGGVYAAIGFDSFQGRKVSDVFGGSIDPENLQVLLLFLVGPRWSSTSPAGIFLTRGWEWSGPLFPRGRRVG